MFYWLLINQFTLFSSRYLILRYLPYKYFFYSKKKKKKYLITKNFLFKSPSYFTLTSTQEFNSLQFFKKKLIVLKRGWGFLKRITFFINKLLNKKKRELPSFSTKSKFNINKKITFIKFITFFKRYNSSGKSLFMQAQKNLKFTKTLNFRYYFYKSMLETLHYTQKYFIKPVTRHKKLKNSITCLSSQNSRELLHNALFVLDQLLVDSKFALSKNHAIFLIKNSFVFVNGRSVIQPYTVVCNGDVIQLFFSRNYFNLYKYYYNMVRMLNFKLKRKIWRLYRHRLDYYKQKPTHFSDTFLPLLPKKFDTPVYLEISFKTLTFIILNTSLNYKQINMYIYKYFNLLNAQLFKWKLTT